jgi:hypothetical protein
VEGPSAALVVAGNRQSDHVAADGAAGRVFLAAVYPVQALHYPSAQVVRALGVQHKAADVDVPAFHFGQNFAYYAETQIGVSFYESWVRGELLKDMAGARSANSRKVPPSRGHSSQRAF